MLNVLTSLSSFSILERFSRKDSEWLPEIEYFGKAHIEDLVQANDAPAVQKASPLTNRGNFT